MDPQLWLKNRAAVQISVLLKWVRIVINLSNVALVGSLGVRSLTEEEKLYIRLRRLGKYFSTGEEIGTSC
jgi:anti-anti-sigma regulatory factor